MSRVNEVGVGGVTGQAGALRINVLGRGLNGGVGPSRASWPTQAQKCAIERGTLSCVGHPPTFG